MHRVFGGSLFVITLQLCKKLQQLGFIFQRHERWWGQVDVTDCSAGGVSDAEL